MSKYIVAARIDENGNIRGGKSGDQTGREVCAQALNGSGSWSRILRPPSGAAIIVKQAYAAAANDNIGYDQSQRTTLYYAARATGFDLAAVGPCECDCSSLVAVLCIAAGFAVSPDIYTGNERAALSRVGFTDMPYNAASLLPGDVLWRKGHTAVYVGTSATYTGGSSSAPHPSNTGTTRPLLDVDGEWGYKTTRALQIAMGTPVDGFIDGQRTCYKKHWPNCLSSSWRWGNSGSSLVIAAVQRVCGCDDDGVAGPKTCRALQARLGVAVDGIFGPNSVKALQRRLNAGGGI